jgi:hypothetical protein
MSYMMFLRLNSCLSQYFIPHNVTVSKWSWSGFMLNFLYVSEHRHNILVNILRYYEACINYIVHSFGFSRSFYERSAKLKIAYVLLLLSLYCMQDADVTKYIRLWKWLQYYYSPFILLFFLWYMMINVFQISGSTLFKHKGKIFLCSFN